MTIRSKQTVTPKELAAQLRMTEKQVRRFLRSMPFYDDGIYTKYEWSKHDPILPRIAASINARKRSSRQSVVTSKGQLVIPAAIRRRYHIKSGTQVHIEELDGGILLRPITDQSIERVRGILAGKGLPERIEKETDRDIR
ncbi:MAG TPA: AbrB/MazE/SpoVT family DNA-binding domain-containing protein [Terriglobales bacterium]|jgi:AbrB family looped-hinge helix DNA binding protein|nr:AbrB/MazE/SpoVT family DNA-binding domain-containing protein [Terriglobales bacterium]